VVVIRRSSGWHAAPLGSGPDAGCCGWRRCAGCGQRRAHPQRGGNQPDREEAVNLAEAHALIGWGKTFIGRGEETEAHIGEALKPIDAKSIGRELNVRYVLEGSVQRGGNRMRVNVQLVDAETGNHLWAERFDKPLADLPGACPWMPPWLDDCHWRSVPLPALERVGRPHRVVASATSMEGIYEPVAAGKAVTISLGAKLPAGLRVVGDDEGLPPLPDDRPPSTSRAGAPSSH
jgi:hypothetical protein